MSEQISRLLIFFLLILLAFFVVRPLVIPATYGVIGRYGAAALDDIAGLPMAHVGAEACGDCHGDVAATLATSEHASIECESCHGAGAAHAATPEESRLFQPPHDEMRQFCGVCHQSRVGRAPVIDTVDIREHNTPDSCVECHFPHEVLQW